MKSFARSLLLSVFCALTIGLTLFVSRLAQADPTIPETPPPAWREGYYSATLYSEFFSSNSNYNDGRGSFSKLTGGNNFTSFENRLKARYATSDTTYLFGGTGFTQSHATDSLLGQDKTNGTFTNVFGGADFLMSRRWMIVVPEFEVAWPLDAPNSTQTNPMTSEGSPYLRFGTFLFKRYRHFRIESYLGLHFPTDNLAKRFMYSLFGEFAFLRGFTFGGGLDGYEAVLLDGKSEAERAALNAQTDATSSRFRAWDPALIEGRVWVGFRPDRAFTFRLGVAKSLNGVRAAAGQSIMLNISFNAPGNAAERVRDLDPESTAATPARLRTQPTTAPRSTAPIKVDAGSDLFIPEAPAGDNSLDATEKILEGH